MSDKPRECNMCAETFPELVAHEQRSGIRRQPLSDCPHHHPDDTRRLTAGATSDADCRTPIVATATLGPSISPDERTPHGDTHHRQPVLGPAAR